MTIQEHEFRAEIGRLEEEIMDLRNRLADLEKKVDRDFKNWTRRDPAI